ncbi:MAG TPA: hypothetical protein VGS79_17880 [Puia sp.]|nr:hypothetical protein [Puia sp.]
MRTEARFVVDELTNSIREVSSGKIFETEVLRVSAAEIKKVHKKDGWFFNWKTEFRESARNLYKLVLAGNNTIQGLISLEPVPNQLFIEMHLIEAAPHNHPSQKKFAGVAGNLVAFACKMSFDLGFEGYVAFTAKTNLVSHYIDSLGAQVIYGQNRMGIFTEAAKNLVDSYYKDYFNDDPEQI